ncbi:U-box domain-containing protein 11 [Senna tora]|uniref:U-box domain-containing protein 11 n=1 Tax=Senna tora TaxID=362788 RepID=A0A834WKZ5_9FABA|nr:U-box domain-containing protein 11 [Senna tora]
MDSKFKHRTIRSLVAKLASVSPQTRLDALCELRLMSKQHPETRPVIAESGAIPFLTDALYSPSHASQDNASATLLNISITAKEPIISTRSVLDAISHALSRHNHNPSSSPSAVQSCAATLHSLLLVDAYRPIIGSKRDIVHALVDIVRTAKSPTRSIKDALKALFGIALHPLNRPGMIELGAVESLFGLISRDGRVGIWEDATAVIAQIAGCEESEAAFREVSGMGVLVDVLMEDSISGVRSLKTKENAISGLLNLVRCGGERVAMDLRVRGLEVFDGIAEVEEKGSAKGKMKAAALMDVLLDDGSHGSTPSGDSSSASGSKVLFVYLDINECFINETS